MTIPLFDVPTPAADTQDFFNQLINEINGVDINFIPFIPSPPSGHDATERIQDALDRYGLIQLQPNATYEIRESLTFSNNSGIIGNNATLYCPAAYFNNTNRDTTHRYGTNAVALAIFGQLTTPYTPLTNAIVRDLHIIGDYADGTATNMITAQNVVGLIIDNVEVAGFAVGAAIALQSVRNFWITRCYLHDYYSNRDWGSAVFTQATGILVGGDEINLVACSHGDVEQNIIQDFTLGAAAIIAWGRQTDGINIAGLGDSSSTRYARYITVDGNKINNCYEAIDSFGHYCAITNNVCQQNDNFGIKLVHGACFTTVTGNVIRGAGIAGIVLAGGGADDDDTYGNVIDGNVIQDIDPDSIYTATITDTCCVLLGSDSSGARVTGNTIRNTFSDPGTNGKYNIKISLTAGDVNSIQMNMLASGTSGWVNNSGTIPAATSIAVTNPTNVRVYMSADQTVNSATPAIIAFDTETVDIRSEFNTSTHLWTCQIPGWYRVVLQCRAAIAVAQVTTFSAYLNSSPISTTQIKPSDTASRSYPLFDDEILVEAGQTISFKASVASGTFDITGNPTLTWATIRALNT